MNFAQQNGKKFVTRYGAWAIVTGASSGIGKALAAELAACGFQLIINARNRENLLTYASELEAAYRVTVLPVAADLATSEGTDTLIRASRNKNIGLLVAAAGYGTSGDFAESSIHTEINMLRTNCESVMLLTHHFGRYFMQQKRGGIILFSSIVAFQGVPHAASYAATKAYIQTLVEGVASEFKKHGVHILAAAPGPVASGFGKRANMNMRIALRPEEIAVPVLRALGRKTTVYPGLLSKLLFGALLTAPRRLKVKIMGAVMNGMTKHQQNTR
jgi:short-subunit dehydrogenase